MDQTMSKLEKESALQRHVELTQEDAVAKSSESVGAMDALRVLFVYIYDTRWRLIRLTIEWTTYGNDRSG